MKLSYYSQVKTANTFVPAKMPRTFDLI